MLIFDVIQKQCLQATKDVFSIIGLQALPIIFAQEAGNEPAPTYCVLNLLNTTQLGRTQESTALWDGEDENAGKYFRTITTTHNLDVQCSFIGVGSFSCAYTFHTNMANNNVCREAYFKKGFSPAATPQLQRIPKFRETDWVEQAVVSTTLKYSQTVYQDTNWIEYIKINDVVYRMIYE